MLRHIIVKEFLQIKRDRRMLPIIFFAPVLQLIILGYAANLDVKDIPVVVCDYDSSQESRNLLSSIFASNYFKQADWNCGNIDFAIDSGKGDLAIIIPSGFGKSIAGGNSSTIQILVNGADSNSATVGLNYVVQAINHFKVSLMSKILSTKTSLNFPKIDVRERILYNPQLKTRFFMVPAILALLLMITTTMLTALSIVKEKEAGTMEQLVVTPLRRRHILLGKLIPFIIIGMIDVLLVTLVAIFWFKVPMRGSIWLLFGFSAIFIFTTLGLGLLVSTVSHTQQQAMMTVMFFVLLPFIYFSGFIFPIENMPKPARLFTYLVPLRYYLTAVRGIFLKGVGISVLFKEAIAMTAIGTGVFLLALSRFKKQI